MLLVPTRACTQVAISLTRTTAKGACLAGPGGIDIENLETVTLSFVLDQSLQLVKRPSVKTASHFFACPNPLTNIRQVFQHNRSCLGSYGLLNNLFAHLVIDMLDAACLFARDFLQQLSRRLRTVGLQAAPLGQKRITCVTNPSSSKKFSATRRSEDVLSKVHTQYSLMGNLSWIREIKDKIEIPGSLPENELGLFGYTLLKIRLLERSRLHGNTDTPLQRVQRNNVALDRVGALVEMDASVPVKTDCRHRFVVRNHFCLIGCTDSKDAVADHLGPQCRRGPDGGVDEVVQGYAVPTSMLHNRRYNAVADGEKLVSQLRQENSLLSGNQKLYTDRSFHGDGILAETVFTHNTRERQCLQVLKDWVSLSSI